MVPERSSTPSSTSPAAAAPPAGGFCPAISHGGKRFIVASGLGGWTAHGSGRTPPSGSGLGRARGEIRNPSAGIVDSQSVKSTGVGGGERGYDGGKKIKGTKRHLLVETEGFLLKAKAHAASIMDRDGIKPLCSKGCANGPRAFLICGWTPATTAKARARTGWRRRWGWPRRSCGARRSRAACGRRKARSPTGTIQGPGGSFFLPEAGFKVLPRRWVVERSFSWVGHNRRTSKDYERLPETGEAFIHVAMARLMARRLARI